MRRKKEILCFLCIFLQNSPHFWRNRWVVRALVFTHAALCVRCLLCSFLCCTNIDTIGNNKTSWRKEIETFAAVRLQSWYMYPAPAATSSSHWVDTLPSCLDPWCLIEDEESAVEVVVDICSPYMSARWRSSSSFAGVVEGVRGLITQERSLVRWGS